MHIKSLDSVQNTDATHTHCLHQRRIHPPSHGNGLSSTIVRSGNWSLHSDTPLEQITDSMLLKQRVQQPSPSTGTDNATVT